MRIIYKMILKFIRYERNNFAYTGCSRTFITIKKCIITKIPIAYLCNRYIYFWNVTKKCMRKNLTNMETWCIICLNQRKTFSRAFDFDIDVFYNRIIIDAKSILGVLSMDLTRVLTVQCHGESKEFNRTLQKFAVAWLSSCKLAPFKVSIKIVKNRYCRERLEIWDSMVSRQHLFFFITQIAI